MLMIDPRRSAEAIAFATYCAAKARAFQVDFQHMITVALRHLEEVDAWETPALLIRASIRPSPSCAADTIARTCSVWATSALTKIARRPQAHTSSPHVARQRRHRAS